MRTAARAFFLFDNGSLSAASTWKMRQVAAVLSEAMGEPVRATSLMHSDKVEAGLLGGESAELLEHAVRRLWEKDAMAEAMLVPAFFGPSRALTRFLPARLNALAATFPGARWRLAPCLVDLQTGSAGAHAETERIATALAEEARATMRVLALSGLAAGARSRVLLVDHGSPERAVTAVRDCLGERVRGILGDDIAALSVASMERREGQAYDFNEPLLARALRAAPFDEGDIIVLQQFLSPGKHAGEGGDIAQICESARAERPGLRTWMTEPIGASEHVIAVLRARLEAMRSE